MIVCSCNVLSERQVRAILIAGVHPRSAGEVHRRLGCRAQCGSCARTMNSMIKCGDHGVAPRSMLMIRAEACDDMPGIAL